MRGRCHISVGGDRSRRHVDRGGYYNPVPSTGNGSSCSNFAGSDIVGKIKVKVNWSVTGPAIAATKVVYKNNTGTVVGSGTDTITLNAPTGTAVKSGSFTDSGQPSPTRPRDHNSWADDVVRALTRPSPFFLVATSRCSRRLAAVCWSRPDSWQLVLFSTKGDDYEEDLPANDSGRSRWWLALTLIPAVEAGAAIQFPPVLPGTVTCNQSLGVWSGSIRFTPPLFNGGTATTEKMTVNASLGNSASPCVTTSGIAVDGAIKGKLIIHRLGCQQVLQGLQRPFSGSDFHLEIQAHLGRPTGGADTVEAAPRFLRCGCTGHDQLDRHRRKGHRVVLPVRDPERHALRLELGRGGPAGLRIDCRSRQPDAGYFSRHLVVRHR